jgi:hypothetical protein
MADREDVRRIGSSLPETEVGPSGMVLSVDGKRFAWPWMERIEPKKARVPNWEVLAVRVANQHEKETLLGMDSTIFFTEPHYDGYPAVLVRLPAIEPGLLEDLLTDAWRTRAPRRLRDGRP